MDESVNGKHSERPLRLNPPLQRLGTTRFEHRHARRTVRAVWIRHGRFRFNVAASSLNGFEQGFHYYDDQLARLTPGAVFGDATLVRLAARFRPSLAAARAQKSDGREVNERFFEWFRERDPRGGLVLLHYMDVHGPYAPPTEFDVFGTEDVDRYDGDILYWDSLFAELVDFLEDEGILDEATIVVTSDHGEEFGEHGGQGHAHSLYEEVVHVPLVIRSPSFEAAVVDARVSLVDVAPTLLDLADADPLPVSDGASLLPFLEGANDAPPTKVRTDHLLTGGIEAHQAFYGDDWKLMYWPGRGQGLLFQLVEDPGEQYDLLHEEHEVALRLLAQFASPRLPFGLATPGTSSEQEVNPELAKTLRALGYVQ